ncbi:site-specific integrase [Akkermansiaceae bacterium]|nr:site-specific integrase [Akkermansiaceae bacterium]
MVRVSSHEERDAKEKHNQEHKMNTQKSTRVSPLRQAMIQHMEDRDLSPRTIKVYVYWVEKLSQHYQRSPAQIRVDEANAYLLHLIRERRAWSSVNQALSGVRMFYRTVMEIERPALKIPPRKRAQKLPEVLTREEVLRLIGAHPTLKYRAALNLLYGCGLRVNEAGTLRVNAIDSKQMRVRVVQGKGKRDRYTILPEATLKVLRSYWKTHRSTDYLFPGQQPGHYASPANIQKAYHVARKRAGITKSGGVHTLRHCFATHHLQVGTDLVTLQRMLGHGSLRTTARYLHVVVSAKEMRNPLDDL